jgi:two-component system chemotaxis response regulator CheY
MIIKRTLRQAGYGSIDVEEASNGREALDIIRRGAPDLVLSDWNMPEVSGIQLLETIQQEGLSARVGFITSQGTAEMRNRARDTGALFLITKPFTAEQVREHLEPLLG